MTNIHAAAERLRRDANGEQVYGDSIAFGNDEGTLADFALGLLDPTPIDEAWLRSEGFTHIDNDPDSEKQFGFMPDGVAIQATANNETRLVTLLGPAATRGAVRALLFALGAGGGE